MTQIRTDRIVFLKDFFEKVSFEEKSADDKKSMENYQACKELILNLLNSSFMFLTLILGR